MSTTLNLSPPTTEQSAQTFTLLTDPGPTPCSTCTPVVGGRTLPPPAPPITPAVTGRENCSVAKLHVWLEQQQPSVTEGGIVEDGISGAYVLLKKVGLEQKIFRTS